MKTLHKADCRCSHPTGVVCFCLLYYFHLLCCLHMVVPHAFVLSGCPVFVFLEEMFGNMDLTLCYFSEIIN